jgi:dolichol-phosphate mannosyltransferase
MVLLIGGIQLISIGIVGEYIGRIYNEIRQRPVFLIKESIGIEGIENN